VEQRVIDWIAKERDGSLNDQDRHALAAWRQADPANESAYRDFQVLLPLIPAGDPADALDPVDLDSAWSRFETRLPTPAPVRRLAPQRLLLRIAAILLLLIAALWYLYRPDGEEVLRYAALADKREVRLQDSSLVILREGAVLTVKAGFDQQSERILQLEGEAFFQVAHDENRPFIVETGALAVQVLGTSFYVAAPGGSGTQSVLVTEGRVSVTQRSSGRQRVLGAGEQLSWAAPGDGHAEPLMDPNMPAWHTGILVFQGAPLSEVLRTMEQHYGIRIRLSDPAMNTCPFSGRLEREAAADALRIVATSMNMTLKSSPEGVYYLTGGNCH